MEQMNDIKEGTFGEIQWASYNLTTKKTNKKIKETMSVNVPLKVTNQQIKF